MPLTCKSSIGLPTGFSRSNAVVVSPFEMFTNLQLKFELDTTLLPLPIKKWYIDLTSRYLIISVCQNQRNDCYSVHCSFMYLYNRQTPSHIRKNDEYCRWSSSHTMIINPMWRRCKILSWQVLMTPNHNSSWRSLEFRLIFIKMIKPVKVTWFGQLLSKKIVGGRGVILM